MWVQVYYFYFNSDNPCQLTHLGIMVVVSEKGSVVSLILVLLVIALELVKLNKGVNVR
jgi:hypothetical protein